MAAALQVDSSSWFDENTPAAEGIRPRGEGDVVHGSISVEARLLALQYCNV